jgi:hypothetical protein
LKEVTVFTKTFLRSLFAAGAVAGLLTACGDDETTGTEDHTPVEFLVLVDGVEEDPPFNLQVGQTVRVRLKFFNEADEDLDSVEDSHFGGLTFNPTSLATATRVADHNYQFDVTGNTAGAGTVTVSYGHSEAADERTFPALPINVVASGGGNPL